MCWSIKSSTLELDYGHGECPPADLAYATSALCRYRFLQNLGNTNHSKNSVKPCTHVQTINHHVIFFCSLLTGASGWEKTMQRLFQHSPASMTLVSTLGREEVDRDFSKCQLFLQEGSPEMTP